MGRPTVDVPGRVSVLHWLFDNFLVGIRELAAPSSNIRMECPQLASRLLVPAVDDAVEISRQLDEPIELAVELGAGGFHA